MKVRLTRQHHNPKKTGLEPLRTNSVEGDAPQPPMVGKRFKMFNCDRAPGGGYGRFVSTSPVKEILPDGSGRFKTTTGSIYKIELLEGPDWAKLGRGESN